MGTSIKRFDSVNQFDAALKSGITLFCGAGFSVMAKDVDGEFLPIGKNLLLELKQRYDYISTYSNLPRACTKIINSDKNSFYDFLEQRFAVSEYDPLYSCLLNINIKSIYTTNIDDLFFKIYENSKNGLRLYNRADGNDLDNYLKIDYYPLHGCIRSDAKDNKYVFGATEIASAFSTHSLQNSWKQLSQDSSKNPILFWGWNFEDSGPIEAMYGSNSRIDDNVQKWVLLYESDPETVDYLTSLNFNIIIGDTKGLLEHIEQKSLEITNEIIVELSEQQQKQLDHYTIPKNDEKLFSSSISNYFLDYTPHWSHIYSNKISKLRSYNKIAENISAGKHVIVIGMRCSGKTTLMMQLLADFNTNKPKHYMISPTIHDIQLYSKLIGETKTILFIDDCFRDTEAVCEVLKSNKIQGVFFDRDFNYERQYHRIQSLEFEKHDITEICREDSQKIIDSIPQELKKENASIPNFSEEPTIVYIMSRILKHRNFKFISRFYEQDEIAAEVFLMICYVHSCGVPCSFDMIYSYLGDENYTWKEMYEIVNRAGNLIKLLTDDDCFNLNDYVQDYYQCRSQYLAEQIINGITVETELLKDVLTRFTLNVPQYKIAKYDKFRRNAYDANLVTKAFPDVSEGEKFYELCATKDDSEYIYQQSALYFKNMKEYKRAFNWIDKARSIAHYNRFSIDSTYAQIYFDVNKSASKEKMEEALDILKKCCTSDKRKTIHFTAFATRVKEYHELYPSEESYAYVEDAMQYINQGISDQNKATSQKVKWALKDLKKCFEKILKER